MAWGKIFKLAIGQGSGEATSDLAIDCSGLDITFRIFRSNIFSANKAEFTIWNPSTETMDRFMQADASDVTVHAGYEDDGTGLIFVGHVLDAHPEWSGADRKMVILATPIRATGFTAKDNKDISALNPFRESLTIQIAETKNQLIEVENRVILKGTNPKVAKTMREQNASDKLNLQSKIKGLEASLEASDIASAQSVTSAQLMTYCLGRETSKVNANTYMSIAYAPGAMLKELIEAVAASAGYPLSGIDMVDWPMRNGYNASYSLKHVLRDIERMLWAKGFGFHVDLSEMVIYNFIEGQQTETVAYLTPESGLLNVAPARIYEYDKERPEVLPPGRTFEIRTILNPRIKPNSAVDVDSIGMEGSTHIKGLYLVESVEFLGDNNGGAFECNVIISEPKPNTVSRQAGESSTAGVA